MHMIVCWAAKGGSGTTVIACALALASARGQEATLVDLGGDCPAALGLSEPSGPGVVDWLASPTAGPGDLDRLAVPVRDDVQLMPRGAGKAPDHQWSRLAATLSGRPSVVVDAGSGEPPRALHEAADLSLLVTRPCYIAIQRARRIGVQPTGIAVIHEPGRALTADDVERAIGAPVVFETRLDPAVARAVDSGLLVARLPRSLILSLRRAA
jgi:MinD superfamily P-loop ATPase